MARDVFMATYGAIGLCSKLAGIGTVVYGMYQKDLTLIAGGMALGYLGQGMMQNHLINQRNLLEEKRITLEKNTLEGKTKV